MLLQLDMVKASFVNGLLKLSTTVNVTSMGAPPASTGDKSDWDLPRTNLEVLPVGLVITSIWAILVMMTMIYNIMGNYQARKSYRQRVKLRMSGGMVKVQKS